MLGVIALSALVGAVRGLTFEVLSLLGWVVAWFAGALARAGARAAPARSATPGSPLNGVAAFACAFLVVLVLWGLRRAAVAALVGKTLLRPLDRLLGAVFGLARGAARAARARRRGHAFTPLGAIAGVARVARRGLAECDRCASCCRSLAPAGRASPAARSV